MNTIRIGIIGGTRGMGNWFARFLEGQGYGVLVYGSKMGRNDVTEMADTCQVVIVSVPIGVTAEVIDKMGPHMCKDALLMDLTSLKREPVKAMLEASVSEVIGCHPLFGPQVDTIAGQRVVLCPARGNRWLPWLKDILERNGAFVVETTPEKHDQMMAIVQGLNHFNTIMMGLALSRTGVSMSELIKFTTPAFEKKMEIIEKVFCQNPRLYAEIITMNPEVLRIIESYEKGVAELKNLLYQGSASDITDMIEKEASFFKATVHSARRGDKT
jgi:prephenate dehydrogenase